MTSKSKSACGVCLTRKPILHAQFLKGFLNRPHTPGPEVFIAAANGCHRFLMALPIPFQSVSQNFVERLRGILAVTLRVLFQLSLAFRFDGYGVHDAFRVGVGGPCVNGLGSCASPRLPLHSARL